MIFKLKELIAINFALFIFMSLDPFFKWILPNEIFYAFFLLTTTLILLNPNAASYISLKKHRLKLLLLFVIYILYFITPIVHSFRIGHFMWFIILLQMLLFSDEILFDSYQRLKKIMVVISAFSLFIFLLKLINIPVPYINYNPDFRPQDYHKYRYYGLSVSLYFGSQPVGAEFGVERINGLFKEPGHFGIYLGILLFIERFNLKSRSNIILLITGILTFSTAFYGIMLVAFMTSSESIRLFLKKFRIVIISSCAIIALSFLIPSIGEIIFKASVGRVFEKTENRDRNIIDSRINERDLYRFQNFIESRKLMVGEGYDTMNDGPYSSQNFRALIIRYGLIGISLILVIIYTLSSGMNWVYKIGFIAISLIILSHRSTFFVSPIIFLLLILNAEVNRFQRTKFTVQSKPHIIR